MNTDEVLKYLLLGDESRIVAETKLNEVSSRSHTVFRINIVSNSKIGKSFAFSVRILIHHLQALLI